MAEDARASALHHSIGRLSKQAIRCHHECDFRRYLTAALLGARQQRSG